MKRAWGRRETVIYLEKNKKKISKKKINFIDLELQNLSD